MNTNQCSHYLGEVSKSSHDNYPVSESGRDGGKPAYLGDGTKPSAVSKNLIFTLTSSADRKYPNRERHTGEVAMRAGNRAR